MRWTDEEKERQVKTCNQMRLNGVTLAGISKALGLSVGTVRTRLSSPVVNPDPVELSEKEALVADLQKVVDQGMALAAGASNTRQYQEACHGLTKAIDQLAKIQGLYKEQEPVLPDEEKPMVIRPLTILL